MSFTDSLLDPARRPEVVKAIADVVESQVAGLSGLSGMAVKTAFNTATKAKEGVVVKGTDKMLPQLAAALEPFWDAKGDQAFGAYLSANKDQASDALLKVADGAAEQNAAMGKVYKGVRGKAKGYIEDALPQLGAAIEPYAA